MLYVIHVDCQQRGVTDLRRQPLCYWLEDHGPIHGNTVNSAVLLAGRRRAGERTMSVRFPASALLSRRGETLNWLSSLPILMRTHSHGDRVAFGLVPTPPPFHLPPRLPGPASTSKQV